MSITIEFDKTIARIILSGDIDYSTQDEIREQNNIAIGAAQVTEIHVDLGAVTFIDSSGIRALLMLQEKAAAGKKTLILYNCRNTIREIFEIGGFDETFTIR